MWVWVVCWLICIDMMKVKKSSNWISSFQQCLPLSTCSTPLWPEKRGKREGKSFDCITRDVLLATFPEFKYTHLWLVDVNLSSCTPLAWCITRIDRRACLQLKLFQPKLHLLRSILKTANNITAIRNVARIVN